MTESKKTNTEKETDITEPLKKGTQEAKEAATEVVEAVKKTTKRAGRRAKKAATSAKKTGEEKSATAKETAANVKNTAKKEYTKAALKETYIQANGCEYKESEILAKVERAYVDAGNKLTSMKSLQLYIKPEDGAAYYVINADFTGKVDL